MADQEQSIAIDRPALQLWLAYPADLLDEQVERACSVVLSEDERERATRFRFDRHRREYLATHALARRALAENHPLPAEAWRFSVGELGKPAPEPACELRFNLSNCDDLVVCLIARGAEAGVDAEPLSRGAEIVDLAPRVFSPAERKQLEELSDAERSDRALTLWVLKEAYIKARGMGLVLELRKISFLFDAHSIQLQTDVSIDADAARWQFGLVEHAGHRVALAVEGRPAGLDVWEARPPLGVARKIEARVEWPGRQGTRTRD